MKKPMLQRSATEINKITGFIMGVRKFGKTSLWADMINAKFGDPEKGLLVSCGMEHGTNMIDNIFTTHANTWKDLVEVKDWLIKEKGNEHKHGFQRGTAHGVSHRRARSPRRALRDTHH